MKAYIEVLCNKLKNELTSNQEFILIKFENFNSPIIYEDICDKFLDIFKSSDINFIAKLSKEKYLQWREISKYDDVLERMISKGYVELEDSLTKWRNESFLNPVNKYCIFLLGAEAVEDKGGLEEFFKVSPEYFEKLIGKKYDEIYSPIGFNFSKEENSIINKLIDNIFIYTSKDLMKLSNRFESIDPASSYVDVIKAITSNMYEDWGIANIKKVQAKDLTGNTLRNKIDLAYKFSKRIAMDYNTDSKMQKIQNNINKYYEDYKDEINDELSDRLPGYLSYEEFGEDLKKYLLGIDLNNIKDKILSIDHSFISSVMKLKTKTDPPNKDKSNKISGNPFKALFLPILMEYSKINSKESLYKIDLEIKSIKLSGTKDKDDIELKNKWSNLIGFLGGIESLVTNFADFTNHEGDEIELSIYSETNDETIYPFDRENINALVKSGVLSSGDNNKTKSTIFITFKFYIDNNILKREYEWNFEDADTWCNCFSILRDPKFIEEIKTEEFLPIIPDTLVNELIDCNSSKELIYLIKNKEYNINNIFNIIDSKYKSNLEIRNLAKSFVDVMNFINQKGLFAAREQFNLIPKLLLDYSDLCLTLKNSVKSGAIDKLTINILTKTFLYLNSKNISEKEIVGCVVPPFHPIMLERIVEQYRYLSNGFLELFNELKKSNKEVKDRIIEKRFNRFIQLSSVRNSIEFMIGKNGYIPPKNNIGYYSIFGEVNDSYCASNMNIDYSLDDSEDYKIGIGTPNSDNITKIVGDYINTYPSKIDGVKIAFFEPKEYKDIILGLNSLINLKRLDFVIDLIIYSSDYRCLESKYFKYWIDENFDEDSNVNIKPRMKYLNLSGSDVRNDLINEIEDVDIMFINDIMTYKDVISEEFDKYNNESTISVSKYPLVYLPIETDSKNTRRVLTSQPQFKCSDDFAQTMVYVNSDIVKDDNFNTVKIVELKDKTKDILRVLNDKSNWLVILDENIDRELISEIGENIIAFATGKGYFGELNLSLSTNINYIEDLKRFLSRRLKKKFSWNMELVKRATELCIKNTKDLDGAQIIKAINPSDESINEYLAFVLTNMLLDVNEENSDKSVKRLISADSYNHIFDEKISLDIIDNLRPDLILFEIDDINSDELLVKIKIIECKLANKNEQHIEKAKNQVISGINRLLEIWDRYNTESIQDRYWYNQLYRILAYNNQFKNEDLFRKLQKINYGEFNIEVSGEIFTYWLDSEDEEPLKENIILCEDYEGNEIEIKHNQINIDYIKSMLVNGSIDQSLIQKEVVRENNIVEKYIDLEKIYNESDPLMKRGNDEVYKEKNIEEEIPEVTTINSLEINNNIDLNSIMACFKDGDYELTSEDDSISSRINNLKKELEFRSIKVIVKGYQVGPDIIRISLQLGIGININQITKFSSDMKIWLGINETPNIFIEDSLVKIDIPRENRQTIRFKSAIIDTFNNPKDILKNKEEKLYVLLGADIVGESKIIDLSDSNNPHLLVAGQTGSGKSVLLASMLTSMMVYYTPNDLEFWLVDPKFVELTIFEESPFTSRSVTTAEDVEVMLKDLSKEMDNRYKMFKENKVQNIVAYNKKVSEDKRIKRIVGVIDEYGILMESGKEFVKVFESELKRLAQLSRAAGIHLIICTQSPKAEILTTTIRNNLPARIGLKVADGIASKLILDSSGAENLLGKGDMYLKTADSANFIRCKSPYIEQDEIEELNEYFKKVGFNINE